MADLHNDIMNLPCNIPRDAWEHSYKIGHRDARHAAAELVVSAGERIAELEAENAALRGAAAAAIINPSCLQITEEGFSAFKEHWDAIKDKCHAGMTLEAVKEVMRTTTAIPAQTGMLTDAQIKAIFLANGFTIKADQSDLKPYVYRAAHAILAAAPAQCAAPDERAAFESWVSASGRAHLLERDTPHLWYKDLTVVAWWTAWQARAALAVQRQSPEVQAQPVVAQPIYQIAIPGKVTPALRWYDVGLADYDTAMPNLRRIIYAAPPAPAAQPEAKEEPATLSDKRIVEIYRESFNAMVGRLREAPHTVPETVMSFARNIEKESLAAAGNRQGQAAQPAFPPRDLSKPAEEQGIFNKFNVTRTDGSSAPGGKHHGCEYFVLDLIHDAYAPAAMRAYAAACRATHGPLADDIEQRFGAAQPEQQPVAWANFADNGNIRIWTSADEQAKNWAEIGGMKLTALYTAPVPAAAPEPLQGWKWMPMKMTDDMAVAFCEAWFSQVRCIDDPEMDDAYAAMLEAAPSPTGEKK